MYVLGLSLRHFVVLTTRSSKSVMIVRKNKHPYLMFGGHVGKEMSATRAVNDARLRHVIESAYCGGPRVLQA